MELAATRKQPEYSALLEWVNLCVDTCRRNGKTKLLWLGDKTKMLGYTPKSDEMVLTVHRWFANKSCPGNWMYDCMGDRAVINRDENGRYAIMSSIKVSALSVVGAKPRIL